MRNPERGRGGWVGEFIGRHPLFLAALVAAGCVLTADWNGFAGLGLAAVLGVGGGFLRGWRIGLAWLICGSMAVGVFSWRHEARNADERRLLENAGGVMQGRVLKDAKGKENFWRAPAVLLTGPPLGAVVWWEGRGELPVAGSRVKARGNFGPLPVTRNPGEFDQAGWLKSQGVATVFHAGWLKGEVATDPLSALGAKLRRGFRAAVTDGLVDDSQEAVVIRAVVIGEQPPDADDLVAAFRNSGTLHAFSVSGLHVAMVGSIGWILLRLAGVHRRWAVLILLPLIFGYSWLTGNSPPAVRSAWMAAVFLGAFVARRRPDLLNALGAVLLVAMLWDGRLLFQPGVQLSYGVVAAIAVGAGWGTRLFSWIAKPELYLPVAMMNRWQSAWLWLRRFVAQSLGVSLVAGIGSTPLTMVHFGLVTPVSVLAGVVFVPLVFILLSASLLAVALYPVVPAATRVVNRANGYVARACVLTARGFAAVPGGHFQLRQDRRPFLLVYDLEHGAGAACFSGGGRGAVMIDCADRYSFKRRVAPSLRRLGVAPDSVVISHPDGGHLGGGATVWDILPIRQALLPVERSRSPAYRSWVDDAPAAGIKTQQAKAFQQLPMPDGARLEILHVPDARSPNAIADDRVAIFRLHWRGRKLLFTSDAGLGTELDLLDAKKDVSADVIIAGRHAGDATLSDRFLDAVNPQAIVASHADFPPGERLKPETVKYWRSRGIQVIHQGESGGVTVRVDDSGNLRLEGFADQSVMILKPR
ncbi:MAG: ComEC/Rec2 family competence protein [Verrucomicrobiota bacterium]